jgi:hypothetical protein
MENEFINVYVQKQEAQIFELLRLKIRLETQLELATKVIETLNTSLEEARAPKEESPEDDF